MPGSNDDGALNAFVTTQWSVVLAAQERSPAAEAALEKLCHTYWRLADEYQHLGKTELFQRLKELLTDETDRASQAEMALELGMSENAVKQAFHRTGQHPRHANEIRELLQDRSPAGSGEQVPVAFLRRVPGHEEHL